MITGTLWFKFVLKMQRENYSKESLKLSSLVSNHQDVLVNVSMGVLLLPVPPQNKSARGSYLLGAGAWSFRSSPPVSGRLPLQQHAGRPPRCEQRPRLLMLPACVRSPVQSEHCLKTTSRRPHASWAGARWRW